MSTPPPAAPGASALSRTALVGVRVFDGHQLSAPRTVVIDGGVIGTDDTGAEEVDAAGRVLLPGLIDAHVHLHGRQTLEQLSSWGVTTALDMACFPPQLLSSLRGVVGLTDIRSAGLPVIGPGSPQARIPGMAERGVLGGPADAEAAVAARMADGSDYIKIVADAPGRGGPEQDVMDAVVAAAHARGRIVVVHAPNTGAFAMALDCGADIITHAPIDRPLPEADVARTAAAGRVSAPTLTMMEGTAAGRPGTSYAAASETVSALHQAGVTVLASTDANAQPGVPFQVEHGASIHHELELLVAAGMTAVEALRSVTSLPARVFSLPDRGAVEPGLRADLVLLDGDPLADIRATRSIARVWCGGVECAVAPAARTQDGS